MHVPSRRLREDSCPLDRTIAALAALDPASAGLWAAEIRALCPQPAARDSALSASGDPIEFAFAWRAGAADCDLRVTCDPAPGESPSRRLEIALAACPGLSDTQAEDVARLCGWLQPAARWGAWVGARLRAGAMRRKLYVEIGAAAPWRDWPFAALFGDPALPIRTLFPVMAGFDMVTGATEVYGHTRNLHPSALSALLRHVGWHSNADALIGELVDLTGRAVRDALPGYAHGVSLAFDASGRPAAFALHFDADSLLGPPATARTAILAAGRRQGRHMRLYAALSSPDAHGHIPWHGPAGFSLDHDGCVSTYFTCAMTGIEPRASACGPRPMVAA